MEHVKQYTHAQNSRTATEIFTLSHRALGREHEELEIVAVHVPVEIVNNW